MAPSLFDCVGKNKGDTAGGRLYMRGLPLLVGYAEPLGFLLIRSAIWSAVRPV